jgi:SAM-dependent methyltransferase
MNEIKNLYNQISKHSQYQILPDSVSTLIGNVTPSINRYEKERFDYINKNLLLKNNSILDIGSNTGFFSIMSLENGAREVSAIEGNIIHSTFLHEVGLEFNLNINVINQYFDDSTQLNKKFDITFLLNVVHHLGDDFGDVNLDIISAKNKIIEVINNLSKVTNYLVFQMGYCWKGNRDLLLFENGTKTEMIDFIKNNVSNKWNIKKIGILNSNGVYEDMTTQNLSKNINLGEFGNRPLFILEVKNNL